MTTNVSRIGRASEITADGGLARIPGNRQLQRSLAQMAGVQIVHSNALAVNTTSTNHFVVPFPGEIIGGTVRITVQQTSANGSIVIEKNGTSIGSVAVNTADTAGTVKSVTIGTGGTISSTDALLNAGDIISFSRPNTGATGVAAVSVVVVPRS